jgi:hypothetical protein
MREDFDGGRGLVPIGELQRDPAGEVKGVEIRRGECPVSAATKSLRRISR